MTSESNRDTVLVRRLQAADPVEPLEIAAAAENLLANMFEGPRTSPRVGRYVLLEQVGRGSFGRVYRAYDPDLAREVAIKAMLVGHDGHKPPAESALNEARTVARLRHPNIVTVYDVGIFEPKALFGDVRAQGVFIVMELLSGMTLKHWLAAQQRTAKEILSVFAAAGAGLAEAHAAGVAHLDFKPANVIVDGARVSVVDFGVARTFGVRPPNPTGEGGLFPSSSSNLAVGGTPAYMAPEQHREEEDVGASADQFAFAVALFQALYAQPAFVGDNEEEVAAAKDSGPPEIPPRRGVPGSVRRALARALQPDRRQRFASMSQFVEAIRARSRTAWGVAVATSLAVGLGAFGTMAHRDSTRCQWVGQRADGLWSTDRAEAVVSSVASAQVPYAADAASRASEKMSEFVREWRDIRTTTCRAEAGASVGGLEERKALCLDRQYQRAHHTVALLEAEGSELAEHVARLMDALPRPQECSREAGAPPIPRWFKEHPSQGLGLTESIAKARALGSIGRSAEARRQAKEVEAVADDLGAVDIAAEAAIERCYWEAASSGLIALRQTCLHAVTRAERARRDDLGALTYVLLSERELRPTRKNNAVAMAEAKYDRFGGSLPELESQLVLAKASALAAKGDDEARELFKRALAAYGRSKGSMSYEVARTLGRYALFEQRFGRFESATELHRRAIGVMIAARGPDHPKTASVYNNLGGHCMQAGDDRCADEALQKALAIKEAAHGEFSTQTYNTRWLLTQHARRCGRFDDVLRWGAQARQVLDLARLHGGARQQVDAMLDDASRRSSGQGCGTKQVLTDPYLREDPAAGAFIADINGRCALEQGETDEAIEVYEMAFTVLDDPKRKLERLLMLPLHIGYAKALQAAGREVEAQESYIRAEALRPSHPQDKRMVRQGLEQLRGKRKAGAL